MLECQYLDFRTIEDPNHLAQISEKLPSARSNHVLKTCHRVEYYGDEDGERPDIFEDTDLGIRTIKSLPQIVERLTNVAAGTESEISAEWAIEEQVARFVQSLPPGDHAKDLGEIAIALARSLRVEFGFYGPDHAELALKEVQRSTKSQTLLVFGAGMIGEKLARNYKRLGYENMALVTRNHKKAKKRMRGVVDPSQIVTLEALRSSFIDPRECDVLIASTDMHSGEYGQNIRDYVLGNSASVVVDVSAQPIMAESDGAITLNAKLMAEFIARHNASLEPKRVSIKNRIGTVVDELAEDLMRRWKNNSNFR